MEEQRIVVFLLEGVRTAKDALGLEKTVMIGGTTFRAVLPVGGRWSTLVAPPAGSGGGEQASRWPSLASGAWGEDASDPVEPRNAVMHQGAGVMDRDQVKAAITAAWAVVRQYDPLPACCHEAGPAQGA